jgi:Lipoprotein LpqB beta-propeller domain/Sporulation and spore germination
VRIARLVTVLAGAALLASAGCAAIPTSSQVNVVGPRATDSAEAPVPQPAAGLDPLTVVRRFIEASASQAADHAAARAYLTIDAKAVWDDSSQVVVLDDTFNTVYSTAAGDVGSGDFSQVLIRGQQLGQVGQDGAFVANRAFVTPIIGLTKVDGQWRINQPPTGLHIRISDFTANYTSVGVRFVDPARETLVTDRRWVPTRPEANLPSRAMDLLLGGPSAAVKDAVDNLLDGAVIRTNVALGDDGVLNVDLTRLPELSEAKRKLAAAQVVATVALGSAGLKVRIQADGAPLVPNKLEWKLGDALPFSPDDSVKPDLPDLAVDHGRVVRIQGGGGVDGPAGTGELAVESAAQSANGELFALVTRNAGAPRLMVGPLNGLQPVAVQASSMTRPTWRSGPTPETWTVINGKDGVGVLRTDAGELLPVGVDVSELSVKGRITELRLSRDGVRAAAIVDGSLYVAIVVGSGSTTMLINPRLLVGPGAFQWADVDWRGPDKIVVATAGRDTLGVFEVAVDGLSWTAFRNTNLTGPVTGIAAAVGRRVYVADASGLWSAADSNELWYSRGLSPGADPFYPG